MPGRLKRINTDFLFTVPKHFSWFYLSYAVFILVQYPVSAAFPTTLAFYALLLPAFIYTTCYLKGYAGDVLGNTTIRLYLALFGYILIHSLFLTEGHVGFSKTLGHTLATAVFLLSTVVFFTHTGTQSKERFFKGLVWLAGFCALVSICIYYAKAQYIEPRLIPLGRADHPILGALVYGVAGIVSLHLFYTTRVLKQKSTYAAIILLIGYLILLTQSRTPMAAYLLCIGLGALLYSKSPLKAIAVAMVLVVIVGAAVMLVPPLKADALAYLEHLLQRGDSFRLALWQQTIEKITTHPWIGYGMQADLDKLPTAPEVYAPHNIYLATAFYIGAPAALWFVGCIFWCFIEGIRNIRDKEMTLALLLMLQGCISALTDYGQLVKSPNPLWIIFWLPIGFVVANTIRKNKAVL